MATALIKVIVPTLDKSIDFHHSSFFWFFSKSSLYWLLLGLSKLKSRPKYLILGEEVLKGASRMEISKLNGSGRLTPKLNGRFYLCWSFAQTMKNNYPNNWEMSLHCRYLLYHQGSNYSRRKGDLDKAHFCWC